MGKFKQYDDEFILKNAYICQLSQEHTLVIIKIKSVSLKIEPWQYIDIYYHGSIFNVTDFIRKVLRQ